ncbi:hypothetical protein AAHC03_04555 [Spirometra sp. Aus1]
MRRPEAIPEEPTLLTSKSPVGDVKSAPDVSQSSPRSTPTRFNQDLVRVDSRRRMMRPEPIPEEPTSSVPTSPADSSQKPMEDINATEAMTEAPLRSSPAKLLPASLTMENEDNLAQPQVEETVPKVSDFVLESASSQRSRTAVDTLPNPTVTAPSVPDTTVLPAVISVPEAVVASSLPSSSQEKEEARSQTSDVDDDVKPDVPAEDSKGPQLLAITPTSGPTTGNLMVKVYGRGLEESVMRHAVILVDDCTLRDSDWSLASFGEAGGTPQGATHCLTIRLPTPLTAGRVFVELETVAHGRLRCPQAFIAVAGRPSYSARGTGQATPDLAGAARAEPVSSAQLNDLSPEVANLLKAVEEANKQIAQMRMTVSALESDVAAKCSEEARISGELYRLRMRLLEDGGLKYLERQ